MKILLHITLCLMLLSLFDTFQSVGSFQDIFLNTSFGGFLVAPNAHVVVGQASKEYAGQTRFLWVKPGSQQEQIATFNRGVIHVSSSN